MREQRKIWQENGDCQRTERGKNFDGKFVFTSSCNQPERCQAAEPSGGGSPEIKVGEDQQRKDCACRRNHRPHGAPALSVERTPNQRAEDEEERKRKGRLE